MAYARRYRFPRSERKEQVLTYIVGTGLDGATVAEVGHWCGLARSPYLLGILDELVREGCLVRLHQDYGAYSAMVYYGVDVV